MLKICQCIYDKLYKVEFPIKKKGSQICFTLLLMLKSNKFKVNFTEVKRLCCAWLFEDIAYGSREMKKNTKSSISFSVEFLFLQSAVFNTVP